MVHNLLVCVHSQPIQITVDICELQNFLCVVCGFHRTPNIPKKIPISFLMQTLQYIATMMRKVAMQNY